jgi:hypothetical protein
MHNALRTLAALPILVAFGSLGASAASPQLNEFSRMPGQEATIQPVDWYW